MYYIFWSQPYTYSLHCATRRKLAPSITAEIEYFHLQQTHESVIIFKCHLTKLSGAWQISEWMWNIGWVILTGETEEFNGGGDKTVTLLLCLP
jgi:hypothetical protein